MARGKKATSAGPAKKPGDCLVPGCVRLKQKRGLCNACYQQALREIEAGRESWESLVNKNLALPFQAVHRSPMAKALKEIRSNVCTH
jgi:hypothetical protein